MVARNGKINITNPIVHPIEVTIYPKKETLKFGLGRRIHFPPAATAITTMIFPNEREKIRGKVQGKMTIITAAKSAFGKHNMNLTNSIKPYEILCDSLTSLYITRDTAYNNRLQNQARIVTDSMRKIELKYIKQNPDTEYSAYLVSRLPAKLALDCLPNVSKNFRHGRLKIFLDHTEELVLRHIATPPEKQIYIR